MNDFSLDDKFICFYMLNNQFEGFVLFFYIKGSTLNPLFKLQNPEKFLTKSVTQEYFLHMCNVPILQQEILETGRRRALYSCAQNIPSLLN